MKRAVALLCASIALCNCCGCGPKQAAPLVLNLPACPAPSVPVLPELDAAEPLDSPENLSRLLERDDRIRAYIDGLNAALRCEQARGKSWETK
ncbi:hypothetical protein [Desulfovibrio sp. SGI.169]|uniref:hypothetical protein n=1 Tax=Desulfovibrio sp. SGI.169 TaxID=3420561 RepID=UPI003D038B97